MFQGRYTAIIVDADAHLLELVRYLVLNPVRAGLVDAPKAWRWSSYLATTGKAKPPPWLAADALLAHFARERAVAVRRYRRYRRFVAQGMGAEPIWTKLNRQVFLGDDDFVARMQALHHKGSSDTAIPQAQQRPPAPPLEEFARTHPSRDAAIAAAHATGAYSYQQIAEVFGVHFTTVGRIVRAARKSIVI